MVDSKDIHGVIIHENGLRRNDYLFRVSLKAVIFDKKGQILVVKEHGCSYRWDLPGGGIDHGESIEEGLSRELLEEVALREKFTYETILVENPRYLDTHNFYQMRIIFQVKPENIIFGVGKDSEEVKFINPAIFKNSEIMTERKIFEYSQLAKNK